MNRLISCDAFEGQLQSTEEERKNDLVEGKYVVEVTKGAAVAVKVTDMLGEEALVLNTR